MESISQKTRVAAYGLVLEKDKILLSRISSQLPRWAGQWTLPGGGLFFGEHPENAMIREVKEETGLTVTATSIAGIDSMLDVTTNPEFHGIRIIYHTGNMSGELVSERNGTSDLAQWFTLEETKDLLLLDLAKAGIQLAFGQGA